MANTTQETFGQRVKRLRESKGTRQVDLAAAAHLSWRHLIRIEKDQGGITKADTAQRIADALGVDVRELTGASDDDEEGAPVSLDDYLRLRVRQLIREEQKVVAR